ncbi:MAG: peptide ABC transporter substrate-binding protein [Tepidisphaeraceae bacterium]|jgi:oligopeptide transport system substrate-binding protein
MLRLLLVPAILAALAAGAVIWSGGTAGSDRADFAFINRGDNKCLDPNQMSWMQDIRIAYALWEGLYTLDPVTLKPILGCADRAQADPQTHTVWTLHIRPDARWSNGEAVTARDFLFAWRRFLETPGEYTYLHFYIRGARQYAAAYADYVKSAQSGVAARRPDFSIVAEQALDDRTLRVTLADPIPFFPALCAFPSFFPLNEKSMAPFAHTDPLTGVTTYDQAFTRPPNLVSNGPYRMAEWTFKRRMRLAASQYYWDRAHVKSRVIDQISADDPLAAFRAYERGEVDWLANVDNAPDLAADLLAKGGRGDLHVFTAFGTYFYTFNCLPTLPDGRKNPLADVRVRQALSMAIDKEPIVREAARLGQPVAATYIPPGVFDDYVSPPGLPYDVAAAARLLADAGYPAGRGFPRLTILYNNEGVHGDVAQIISRQWLRNLGIETALEGVEIKIFGARLYNQQYDIARASWYGDYDDPSTFTDKYLSDAENNEAKWSNARYDQLCAEAQKEVDAHRRLQLLSQAEHLLLQDAPILPLYHYVNGYMFRDNVKGIPLAPSAMQMFKAIEVIR